MEIGSRVRSCDGNFLLDAKNLLDPYRSCERMKSKAMYHIEGIFFSEWEQKGSTRWGPPSPLISQNVW